VNNLNKSLLPVPIKRYTRRSNQNFVSIFRTILLNGGSKDLRLTFVKKCIQITKSTHPTTQHSLAFGRRFNDGVGMLYSLAHRPCNNKLARSLVCAQEVVDNLNAQTF
jgi:hypothetical protein